MHSLFWLCGVWLHAWLASLHSSFESWYRDRKQERGSRGLAIYTVQRGTDPTYFYRNMIRTSLWDCESMRLLQLLWEKKCACIAGHWVMVGEVNPSTVASCAHILTFIVEHPLLCGQYPPKWNHLYSFTLHSITLSLTWWLVYMAHSTIMCHILGEQWAWCNGGSSGWMAEKTLSQSAHLERNRRCCWGTRLQ